MTKKMTQRQSSPLQAQIDVLEELFNTFQSTTTLAEKLSFLNHRPQVIQGLEAHPLLKEFVLKSPLISQYVIKSVLAIGQGDVVFSNLECCDHPLEKLNLLVEKLLDLEKFYDSIGGVIGYQLTILRVMTANDRLEEIDESRFEKPEGLDISQDTLSVRQAVRWGVEALRQVAMIYPVGGAGDRLSLHDEVTGELLPAAQLIFCGHTLLEGLIRDLQGWEFLYYKLFGKQLVTPIAMMTSHEKKNDQRIRNLCEAHEWFGRRSESFRFFLQPLVPMISTDGDWIMSDAVQPMFKPGGHGVVWKVAQDHGIFDWFEQQQKKKAIVRQINNPVAGTDHGLIALAGIGCHHDKAFGFVSCQRLLKTPEGMNVLKEIKRPGKGYECCITNVEYTDFTRHGIEDMPAKPGSSYSRFPSNTNILFADLEAIKHALKICPIPGILVNMKSRVVCWHAENPEEKLAGRLESTMQNIADCITDMLPHPLKKAEYCHLRTFLIYNERQKTISVVKKSYVPGEMLNGTPEGCFHEQIENHRDLLANHCGMTMPPRQDEKDYLSNGPNFTALFHPALGRLYSVIRQKIRRGCVANGADWIIEASEVDIETLDLAGSLVIEADAVMGKRDAHGIIVYDSECCGKCTLLNVQVRNKGMKSRGWHDAWQNLPGESLHILLHGNAEFFAENVEFTGDFHFEVPDGHRLVVYRQGGELAWHFEKIMQATWRWDYTFNEKEQICLEKTKIKRG